MEELAEAIHRVDTGVNQSPGLEDKRVKALHCKRVIVEIFMFQSFCHPFPSGCVLLENSIPILLIIVSPMLRAGLPRTKLGTE